MPTRVPVTVKRVPFLIPPWVIAMVPKPRLIWVRQRVPLTERLLAHELCHVLQAERHSWPLAYFVQWITTGFSYTRMPFEREARRAESEPFYLAWAANVLTMVVRD